MGEIDSEQRVEADPRVERTKRQSIWEGCFSGTMTALGDQLFSAFGVFLNASPFQLGLLGSLPQLLGSLGQLWLTRLLKVFKTRKRLVATAVLLQALTLIPIMLVFLAKDFSVWLLLLFSSLYFIFGMLSNPAWSSWMGDVVETKERGAYFGRRNSINGTVLFIMMILGGLVLQYFKGSEAALTGFILLFCVAMLGRLLSMVMLLRQYEPPYTPPQHEVEGFFGFIRGATRTNYGMVVLFMASMNGVVAVAGPFFTAYMLSDLHMGYLAFTILTGVSLLVKYLMMPVWGKAVDRYGTRKVLILSGFLIPGVSLLWLFGTSFEWLLVAQVFSGFAWAGFELASFNFLLDATEPAKRPTYIAYYNVVNGIFVFIGALAGALLLKYTHLFWSAFLLTLVVSTILRLIVAVYYSPRLREVRSVDHISYKDLLFNILSIDSNVGLQHQVTVINKEIIRPLEKRTRQIMDPLVKPIKRLGGPVLEETEELVKDAAEFQKEAVAGTVKNLERVTNLDEVVSDAVKIEAAVAEQVTEGVEQMTGRVKHIHKRVKRVHRHVRHARKRMHKRVVKRVKDVHGQVHGHVSKNVLKIKKAVRRRLKK
jgi:MFS family permease